MRFSNENEKKQRSDEEIDVTFLVCIKFHVK